MRDLPEGLATTFISSNRADMVAYGFLIVTLVFLPKGLFGAGGNVSEPTRAQRLTPALPALLVFAVTPLPLWTLGKGYYGQVANVVLISAPLAAALHLVTGVAGLHNPGHAAFSRRRRLCRGPTTSASRCSFSL